MGATDLIDTIKALADAKVPCPKHPAPVSVSQERRLAVQCADCKGTGEVPNPLTKSLRVECVHGHSVNPKHWADEKKHRADCPGFRAATPQEAEAVGLKMLEAMPMDLLHHGEKGWETFHLGFPVVGDKRWSPTPLEAILNALAEALGVEVESDVSSRP